MTNTDICNMALSFLSKGSVKSMTEENTEEARQCRTHYENCRRLLLRSYPWGFARRKVQLALLDARFPGWRFVYRYPGKCLNIAYVYDEAQAYARIAQKQRFETALMDAESRRTWIFSRRNLRRRWRTSWQAPWLWRLQGRRL